MSTAGAPAPRSSPPTETLRAVCPELALSAVCPYRSLNAFTAADEEFFRGRDRAVDAVLAGLERDRRFLAVFGPSGSGKTSLIQAGVLPRLAEGALAGSDRWGVIVTRPGADLLAELERAGLAGACEDLGRAVGDWLGAHPEARRLVLVVDQFEELLVSVPAAQRTGAVSQLVAALERSLPLTVVMVMRDDFYSRLAESAAGLMPWVGRNSVDVPAELHAHELAAIVERPSSPMQPQADLADRIVADAIETARAVGPDGRSACSTVLPLLEFALTELWERRADGWLTHHAYDQIGGVTGGLGQWCDRALGALDAGLRPVARRVLTALVSVGDEAQGIPDSRRRRTIAELSAGDSEAVGEVVQRLTAARLLVTSRRDDDGQASVELIHEALLRQWPQLQQWLAEDRDFLAWRQRIERPTGVWIASSSGDDAQGDADLLLRGRQLAEAEDWLEQRSAELPAAQVGYVKASRDRRDYERNRDRDRIRILTSLTAGLVVLLLVAVGAGVLAWVRTDQAREQARVIRARGLAAQATVRLLEQPDLSLLLSLEGLRTAVTEEARASLLSGLLQSHHRNIRLTGHYNSVSDVAFSLSGNRIASADLGGTVRLWDAATGTPIGQPLTGHTDQVYGVAFSPDGTTLASASFDETVWLWLMRIEDWIRLACELAHRNLSRQEWDQFVGKGAPYVRNCPAFPAGVGAPADAPAADYRLTGNELGL